MGIFDSLVSVAKSVATALIPTKAKIENVGAVLNSAFNPFAANKGVTANVSNPTLKSVLESVASHPYVSAGIVAGGITAVENPTILKALIPSSNKGRIIAAVATPIFAGAVINQPAKAIQALTSAPSNLSNFGGNISNLAANPSLENLKTLAKENPVLTTAAGGLAVATIGGGVGLAANTISTYLNSKATKANTEATLGGEDNSSLVHENYSGNETASSTVASNQQYPITPATKTINSKSSSKTRRSRARLKEKQSTQQNVRVTLINQNNSLNKRFIKREVLYN